MTFLGVIVSNHHEQRLLTRLILYGASNMGGDRRPPQKKRPTPFGLTEGHFGGPKHRHHHLNSMKTIKFLMVPMIWAMVCLTGCLKDPGNPTLAAEKSTVKVGEEITIQLGGADHYTCLRWAQLSGPAYTIVSGGGTNDPSITVRFDAPGEAKIQVGVKNCRNGDDPCTGDCRSEYADISISVN